MVEVAGRPFVDHQLSLLRRHGAEKVVLCLGYRADAVEKHVGDGSRYGLDVRYSHDGLEVAGTAGAVRAALPLLGDEFMVLYGDTYLRIDYADVVSAFQGSALSALMTVLWNRGRWGASNVVYRDDRIVAYNKRQPPQDAEWIDYGLSMFNREVIERSNESDLGDVQQRLASQGQLAGYVATRRFYEIGTPDGLKDTRVFLTPISLEQAGGP
jgi:NDP-sugar pyrophosphorylase family protein